MFEELDNRKLRKQFLERFPSNNELAEKLKMHASDLSAWKTGSKNLGIKTLARIYNLLGQEVEIRD